MNAALLLEHYARIADAPDAIVQLRRFVLDLAVRGKLVGQDGERGHIDGPDGPFAIPSNWCWRRIGDELELLNGMAFKPTDWVLTGLPIVRIQNLNNPLAPFNFCDPAKARDRSLIDDGAFLISWSGTPGTSFGAFIWQRGEAVLNQHIFRCDFKTKNFAPDFLRLAINGRLDEMIAKAHGGVGLQHITKGKLEAMLIALPPLTEQHRIVAKVDELMALCDQLETARTKRETARDTFTLSILAKLNTPDPETFEQDARFALANLAALTTRHDQIKQLRRTILSLAVAGKLVDQHDVDASIAPVLEAIAPPAAIRRKSRNGPTLGDGPFDIPESWIWATLGQVITHGPQNGLSPKSVNDTSAPKAITLTATTSGWFNPAHFKNVDARLEPFSEFWLQDGDLLFQRGNTREYVGMAAIFRGPPVTFIYPDLMMKVRIAESLCLPFIHLCAIAPYARGYMAEHAAGAQETMPKINQSTLIALPIPLPPVAEQHRIVAKVNELMALCDQLEGSITTGERTRARLLEAVLNNALEPA